MARLRSPDVIAATTPDGVPVALLDPLHPVWSTPRDADTWRTTNDLRTVAPVALMFKPPATGCRLRHAAALADWCTARGIDPKRAAELTGWTTRPTAMERAAARAGTDYLQSRPS